MQSFRKTDFLHDHVGINGKVQMHSLHILFAFSDAYVGIYAHLGTE